MKAIVIYESEFGATRRIAEAISDGLASQALTEVRNVRDLVLDEPDWRPMPSDLLVIGCPTHIRSMPTPLTRANAQSWPDRPGSTLVLEPRPLVNGVREWLAGVDLVDQRIAAFATRADIPRILGGSAAPAVARAARRRGGNVIAAPKSFVITKDGGVTREELAVARDWGRALGVEVRTNRNLV